MGETSNCYGDAARQVGIKDLEDRGAFIMVLGEDVHNDDVCINGRFVYNIKHKPWESGHAKTEAYIDSRSRLGARVA